MWIDDSSKKGFIKITERQFGERYTLLQSLGKGNYGEVFMARSAHGHLAAIKQFRSQATQQFHMIIREISNLKKLDHPNILKFYDCYIVDDYKYYMVTEFCQGGALTDFIAKTPTEHARLTLCQQMAEGLAYAHSQGIVHRDLKPENILIGQRNTAKIADFGCSTRLEASNSDVLTSRVGSPAYMDYRVGRRQEYDHTADLYSLGMVFLWVFEGKGIYDECKSLTDLNHHQSQISRDYDNAIQAYLHRLPTPLDAIVKNCLSPDYRNRHSAQAIANMLAARLSQENSPTMTSTQDEIEERESDRVQFAYRLMGVHRDFERRYRSEKLRDSVLRLLLHNQQTLGKLEAIQEMRHVGVDTKAQFTFLVFLYYLAWLAQAALLFRAQPSQLAKRYPDIDAKAIDPELLQLVERHIAGEAERVTSALLKCAHRIQGTLHLLSPDKYLPAHFREFVRAAYQQDALPLSLLQEKDHLANVAEFFAQRVKAEHDYSCGTGEADKRLGVVGEIAGAFR